MLNHVLKFHENITKHFTHFTQDTLFKVPISKETVKTATNQTECFIKLTSNSCLNHQMKILKYSFYFAS